MTLRPWLPPATLLDHPLFLVRSNHPLWQQQVALGMDGREKRQGLWAEKNPQTLTSNRMTGPRTRMRLRPGAGDEVPLRIQKYRRKVFAA